MPHRIRTVWPVKAVTAHISAAAPEALSDNEYNSIIPGVCTSIDLPVQCFTGTYKAEKSRQPVHKAQGVRHFHLYCMLTSNPLPSSPPLSGQLSIITASVLFPKVLHDLGKVAHYPFHAGTGLPATWQHRIRLEEQIHRTSTISGASLVSLSLQKRLWTG